MKKKVMRPRDCQYPKDAGAGPMACANDTFFGPRVTLWSGVTGDTAYLRRLAAWLVKAAEWVEQERAKRA